MRKFGELMVGTVAEIAKYVAENIPMTTSRIGDWKCDFVTIDGLENESFTDILLNAHGWYGMKQVNLGFDSSTMTIAADYYGGGCAAITQLWSCDRDEARWSIQKLILDTLGYCELAKENTMLLAEFC